MPRLSSTRRPLKWFPLNKSAQAWIELFGDTRLNMRHVTVGRCVMKAYRIPEDRILGGPKWTHDNQYDIDAKADHPATGDEMAMMLRWMLADRFHLAIHSENRNLSAFILMVAKQGIKAKAVGAGRPAAELNTTIGGPGAPGFWFFLLSPPGIMFPRSRPPLFRRFG
jgi:uncharacterized protein (TIGR03435 family)